jgi:predicted ABC-type sugar transport system permease subunit
MQDTVFTSMIAKILVLCSAVIDQFVTGVVYTPGNIFNCTPAAYTGGTLTACGQSLVLQLPLLAAQGIGLLNGLLVALGIS